LCNARWLYTEQEEINKRDFVRYFILILCNTGLRFGELRYLKWKDVSLIKESDGSITSEIDVHIGKTGKIAAGYSLQVVVCGF
jgi:hypothetical protein